MSSANGFQNTVRFDRRDERARFHDALIHPRFPLVIKNTPTLSSFALGARQQHSGNKTISHDRADNKTTVKKPSPLFCLDYGIFVLKRAEAQIFLLLYLIKRKPLPQLRNNWWILSSVSPFSFTIPRRWNVNVYSSHFSRRFGASNSGFMAAQ